MNRRVIAVLVAVLLAVVGAALVINYVRGADARAVADAQPIPVYVASQAVPAGTTLKDALRSELITETTVAASAFPAGALEEIGPDNNALLALSDVQAGEFLMTDRFGTTPTGEKAIEVPPGMVAMSVELSDPARVGQFVTPGTDIAIYATHSIKAVGEDDETKAFNELDIHGTHVLLPEVKVIAMGDTALAAPPAAKDEDKEGEAEANAAPSFLVTVAVTPEDAPRLAHGINQYTLYAGLRGSDVQIDKNSQANDLTVFPQDVADLLSEVQ
ncbi:RcpC/CpaB family pilus assembly protein [Janibacter sp. DB-40]|uniref:Flp pilus assembly protein CpaB n=1 Tax=Janibacter sp. DB-40 TaxID=3028808 RepID=UPI002406C97E|nr:RcpC/CpaB family pilus assembly protein [Janibacter sp. DB-40]